jgi:hypothetical protein
MGGGSALLLAIIFNVITVFNIHGKTDDIETWSGKVIRIEHHPKWIERWIELHVETYPCGTDSKGNTTYCTRTYTTIEYDTHREHWVAIRDFGSFVDAIDIGYNLYLEIGKLLGGTIIKDGKQSYHHSGSLSSGDDSIYKTENITGYLYPAMIKFKFENKIKATPNLFGYSKIPTNITILNYPENNNWNQSDRLMGGAVKYINLLKLDQLNARLGPTKRVNVILIGLKDFNEAEYYRSKFLGGKKNDLILTFSGGNKTNAAQNAMVFGWTDKELVKKNLETILLTNPINDDILPLIENEIKKNYLLKDWSRFDYITVSPDNWVYYWFFGLIILTQAGLYVVFHCNDLGKDYWNR